MTRRNKSWGPWSHGNGALGSGLSQVRGARGRRRADVRLGREPLAGAARDGARRAVPAARGRGARGRERDLG